MDWIIQRDSPGESAAADIDAEMGLLDAALADPARRILRLWRTRRCLVVTPLLAHRAEFAAAANASAVRGWPVVVRRTGGGPVPQGPETLNISLAFAAAREGAPTIDATFREFADRLIAALAACRLTAEIGEIAGSCCPGRYDIAIAGRKVIGIAQRRRQGRHGEQLLTAILVHAIFWFEGNLAEGTDALERFLAEAGAPQRFARDRMATLQELTDGRITGAEFEAALLSAGSNINIA